jgi:multidrug efflux pump subunit AcrB
MMALSFHRTPRFVVLLLLVVTALGAAGFLSLPRLEDPTLSPRFALIKTFMPGSDAARMETEISQPLEERLLEVDTIRLMRSQSRPGISVVIVELKDSVEDLEAAWAEIREKLDLAAASFPPGASSPELERTDVRAFALILALSWNDPSVPVNQALLQRQTKELKDRVLAVPGTEEVKTFGSSPEEISIIVDRARLQGLGQSLVAVAERLAAQEARVVSGEVVGENNRYVVRTDSDFETLEDVRAMPLLETLDGGFVSVEAVGTVKRGLSQPVLEMASIAGRPAVVLGVYAEDAVRVDIWTGRVKSQLADYPVPAGMQLDFVFEQSKTVESRFSSLLWNLGLSIAAVMLVVLVMMGPRAALVVGAAIPMTSACLLGAMAFLGIPIHQMSVTGLIVALGLLVDNAIVVVDELKLEREAGHSEEESIGLVSKRLTLPLASSTATTVLAFLPIALLPGGVGEFVGTIALTVIIALIFSLGLSLWVLPSIFFWVFRRPQPRPDMWNSPKLVSTYRWLFARPILPVALSLMLPVAGFLSAPGLKEQFFPPTDRPQIRMVVELPNSRTLEATRQATEVIRKRCLEYPQIAEVHWFLGRSVPKFYYNLLQNRDREPFFAEALVELKDPSGTTALIRELQRDLEARFPEARPRVIQLEQGPPFEAPVEIHLFGSDMVAQRRAGELLRQALADNPEVVSTRATLSDDLAQVEMVFDEAQIRRAGLEPEQVAAYLGLATQGRVVGTVFEETERLPVRLRFADQQRRDIDELASVTIPTPSGSLPLSSFVRWELRPEQAVIAHRHQQRCNSVQAFLQAGALPSKVLKPVVEQLESGRLALPTGVRYEVGGEAAERNRAVGNLVVYVPPLMILMVGSLVLSFRSFRLSFLVGLVGLLSVGTGFGLLASMGIPFGFMAIIGTMGLLGVAVNDSTVVITALQETAADGDLDKVASSVARSTRHVVATTLTTIAGFLPLLLGADRFWHPLAGMIAGGVGGATLSALLLCPVVFRLITRVRRRSTPVASVAVG